MTGRARGRRGRKTAAGDLLVLLPGAALLLLLPFAASCGSEGGEAADAGRFVKTGSNLTVTLEVDPFPPRAMHTASFTITLTDSHGHPVQGAGVTCDMTMPAMMMPENRPQAAEREPGVYAADVLFTMAGEWEAAVQITLPDRSSETFTFAMSTG